MTNPTQPDWPVLLLIDDEPTESSAYLTVLSERFRVVTARRGEVGYAFAFTCRPDVVVIDVRLPDMDGLELCQRLHANAETAAIPLVVLTACDDGFHRALVAPNLAAVLSKPCSPEHLVATLRPFAVRATGRTAAPFRS